MNAYNEFEGEVIYAIQDLLDIPHGDASGMVECQGPIVMIGFLADTTPKDVALQIMGIDCAIEYAARNA